jgi:hypothetical protein
LRLDAEKENPPSAGFLLPVILVSLGLEAFLEQYSSKSRTNHQQQTAD